MGANTQAAGQSYADVYDDLEGPRTAKFAAIGNDALGQTTARMQRTIMGIGSAVIGAFLIIVVLSQVVNLDIVQSMVEPDAANRSVWGNLTVAFIDYGTAAMTLVGIGLIIYGASYAMNMFNGWGGGGR